MSAEGETVEASMAELDPTAPQTGTIAGQVATADGQGRAGVKVDLFIEDRAAFLRATTTDTTGDFAFDVDPGCYVLTFIAPDGEVFAATGARFKNTALCVEAGQTSAGNDARLDQPAETVATIEGRITGHGDASISDVKVELFTATDDRRRDRFLGFTTTGADGTFAFDIDDPGCHVVTFIAPDGTSFAATGGRFKNSHVCVEAGQTEGSVDAVVVGTGSASIGDRVTNADGTPAPGVKINLFAADADGRRGRFLGPAFTNRDGNYRYEVTAGCYVVVFIAPEGRTFTGSGGRFQEASLCVEDGETRDDVDAVLS